MKLNLYIVLITMKNWLVKRAPVPVNGPRGVIVMQSTRIVKVKYHYVWLIFIGI